MILNESIIITLVKITGLKDICLALLKVLVAK